MPAFDTYGNNTQHVTKHTRILIKYFRHFQNLYVATGFTKCLLYFNLLASGSNLVLTCSSNAYTFFSLSIALRFFMTSIENSWTIWHALRCF